MVLQPHQRASKRLLDVVGAGVGLALLWPLLVVLAVLVRLSSPGPVIFRHVRIGQHGARIEVLKFRTMVSTGGQMGPQVTVAGDPRLTPLGIRLRKLKLDELITRRYKLDDVNQGYQDMLDGKNIRGVIIHEH